ncbi:MAG: hypothetical protein QOC99_180 [Acidobacteriota bacterium]|nr:hypothetical protein [Acidobacteriota bacterium]
MSSVIRSILQRRQAENDIKREFENLKDGDFNVTSRWTGVYNCIAHAARDPKRKWWPVPEGSTDAYWPTATRRRTARAFIRAFQTLGYEPCDNGELEAGYEKVAIYVSDKATPENPLDSPTHMARQLPCGKWTSKLGGKEDIVHDSLDSLAGKEYGRVHSFMKRRVIQIMRLEEKQEAENGEQAAIAE